MTIASLEMPLSVFLLPFGLFLLFYVFYSFFNVYHLVKFGIYGFGAFLIVTVYAGVSIFLLGAIFSVIGLYDWSIPFSLSDFFPYGINTEFFDSTSF